MKKLLLRITGLAVFFVAAFAANMAAKSFFEPSKEQKAASLAAALGEISATVSKSVPQKLDAATTLVEVRNTSDTLTYRYAIAPEGVADFQLSSWELQSRLDKTLCATDARELIRAGATFTYEYWTQDNAKKLGEAMVRFCF